MQKAKQRPPFRIVVHGLKFFCRKLPVLLGGDRWDVKDYSHHRASEFPSFLFDLAQCDLAYAWGGRISMGKFLRAARALGRERIVIFWSGSDVLFAKEELAAGRMDPWVRGRVHWAASPALAEEVRSLGIDCEYVQASFVDIVAVPRPLPEKFSVLAYLPSVKRAQLYGWEAILEVAEALPSIEFTIVGLQPGQTLATPPNVVTYSWVSDLSPFFGRASVLWRPVQHDAGTSFMVLEALAHGRHVIYTNRHAGCVCAQTAQLARRELERLISLHESKRLGLNEAGRDYIAQHCSPERVRAEILGRWEKLILAPSSISRDSLTEPQAANAEREVLR